MLVERPELLMSAPVVGPEETPRSLTKAPLPRYRPSTSTVQLSLFSIHNTYGARSIPAGRRNSCLSVQAEAPVERVTMSAKVKFCNLVRISSPTSAQTESKMHCPS